MQRERPTSVLVIAILNFIFGGLGLLGMLCLGVIILFFIGLSGAPGPKGSPNPMKEMVDAFGKAPGIVPFLVFSIVSGLFTSILLIVAGVGLLKMKSSARYACIFYGIYNTVTTLGGLVYSVMVLNPSLERWQAGVVAGNPRGAPPPTLAGFDNVSSVCSSVIGIIYGIVVLVIMFLPDVRAAFAGESTDRPDDFGDFDSRRPSY